MNDTLSPKAQRALAKLQRAVSRAQAAQRAIDAAQLSADRAVAGLTFDDMQAINALGVVPRIVEQSLMHGGGQSAVVVSNGSWSDFLA